MASPLRWFRRHQQIMMVFFGVGLMAIFGLGSVFTMINPRELGSTEDNPLVATWSEGEFRRKELDSARMHHYATQRFLSGLQQYAADQVGETYRPLAQPITPLDMGRQYDQETVDQNVMIRAMLAEYAKEEGYVVSDDMVEDYLSLTAGNVQVTRDELMAINKEVNNTSDLTMVYERLKLELAAQQMETFVSAIPLIRNSQFLPPALSPSEAMDLHSRIVRRVECQVLPIEIDGSTVTEQPADSELEAIYEEGKDRLAGFSTLEPGFRIPRKIKAQYFVADFEQYLQAEMSSLSDKDVQEEYERRVAAEDPLVMELVPMDDGPELNLPGENPGDGDQDPEGEGEAAKPGDSEKSDSDSSTAEGQPETTGGEQKKEGGSGDNNSGSGDSNSGAGSENDQAVVTAGRDRFVSTIQDEQKQDEQKQEETGKTEGQGEAAGGNQDTTENADPAAKQEDQKTGDSAENAGADQETPIQLPEIAETPKPQQRVRPLKDVAETLKREMKREDALKKMKAAIQLANREIGDYKYVYSQWKNAPEGAMDVEEPGAFDGETFAKKYNLKFVETEFLTQEDLAKDELGMQSVERTFPGMRIKFPVPVATDIFQNFDNSQLFAASEAISGTGSSYLFWVAEKQESYAPEFDEVKNEVLEFWKTQQAYEQAMADGKDIAERLNRTNKLLKDEYPEKSVPTGQFTWFNSLQGLNISNPNGISDAGDELMEMVFGLNENEVGVGKNESGKTVYVVQMVNTGQTTEEVTDDYITEEFFRLQQIPPKTVAASDFYSSQFSRNWMESFLDGMGFKRVEQ